MHKIYIELAHCVAVIHNPNALYDFVEKAKERIAYIERNELPSGSGFDNGTTLDIDASAPDKLVFVTSFHHMNDNGYYTGWTHHRVVISPSLRFGFNIKVTGRNKNDIKEYIAETFHYALDGSWNAAI